MEQLVLQARCTALHATLGSHWGSQGSLSVLPSATIAVDDMAVASCA